jgi:hypothetical protein
MGEPDASNSVSGASQAGAFHPSVAVLGGLGIVALALVVWAFPVFVRYYTEAPLPMLAGIGLGLLVYSPTFLFLAHMMRNEQYPRFLYWAVPLWSTILKRVGRIFHQFACSGNLGRDRLACGLERLSGWCHWLQPEVQQPLAPAGLGLGGFLLVVVTHSLQDKFGKILSVLPIAMLEPLFVWLGATEDNMGGSCSR